MSAQEMRITKNVLKTVEIILKMISHLDLRTWQGNEHVSLHDRTLSFGRGRP